MSKTIAENVKELVDLVLAGKALDAFEKFYAEDIVMQENDQEPRVGKALNREVERDFVSKIQTIRTYACDGIIVSGDRAFVVWRVDIDHASWGVFKTSQVAVQEWRDGKIHREKFVYW